MLFRFNIGTKVRIKSRLEVKDPYLRNKEGTVISSAGHRCENDEVMVKLENGRELPVKKRNLSEFLNP